MRLAVIGMALTFATAPGAAAAQETAATDDAGPIVDMAALEAAVAPQPWYPDGYYDLRIAAEAEVAGFPRPVGDTHVAPADGAAPVHILSPCDAAPAPGGGDGGDSDRRAAVARETARLRAEFIRLGYPVDVYAAPLEGFEKAQLARADAGAAMSFDAYSALVAATEATRQRQAPNLPAFTTGGACNPRLHVESGAPAGGAIAGILGSTYGGLMKSGAWPSRGSDALVIVATDPGPAEVLLINAFAFNVCRRNQADVWNKLACKWKEIETGTASPLAGNYVYQVRWPDGVVRKGARTITPDPASEAPTRVTFKKIGS